MSVNVLESMRLNTPSQYMPRTSELDENADEEPPSAPPKTSIIPIQRLHAGPFPVLSICPYPSSSLRA